jgi:PLP dependent protein
MSSIKDNLDQIRAEISDTALTAGRKAEDLLLIAVSKKKTIADIRAAIEAGADNFGENYMQEAVEKIEAIGNDKVCWHFIGHLQSNKAQLAVKYFDYIQTVDSVKLAKEINKQAKAMNKIQKILIQLNIAHEDTKSGIDATEILNLAEQINAMENLSVQGLMCMPPFFDDPELARPYFKKLSQLRQKIMDKGFERISMKHLSMGMSSDFKVAVQEGSTMVRIGTSIFGERS